MILSKLYSNKAFKTVKFSEGLNVVLAKVSKPLDKDIDSHNLGKTTIISIIDFCLLKKITEDNLLKKHKDFFTGYEFFLEIKLNSGSYLTIKRSVDTPTKISFKKHILKDQNFVLEQKWDENLPFQKSIEYLNEALDFDVLRRNWTFRKFVSYFLRTQFDFKEIFQLNKFSKSLDKDWKPFMFHLLGFNSDLLEKKYDIELKKKKQEELIQAIKQENSVDEDQYDRIKGEIELKKEEIYEFESEINNFDFYNKEINLKKDLIENVENNISNLNTLEYNLEMEIENIQNSLSKQINFDIDEVKQIYQETEIYFPDNLVKDYKQLQDFNRKITQEREKYLKETLEKAKDKLLFVRKELEDQNSKRIELLSVIKDKDSFNKFKIYQKDIITLKSQLIKLEEQLKSINNIENFNNKIEKFNDELKTLTHEIVNEINSDEVTIYPRIRKAFNKYMKSIANVTAYIYIKPNKTGNIDFKEEIAKNDDVESEITAKTKGTSYKKFLSIAFDLAIITSYRNKSFFRFIYHDGSLEGLDNRKKLNFINLIRELCNEYKIQYIFTTIEDDLPIIEGERYSFSENEISVTLSDNGDSGKLFLKTF